MFLELYEKIWYFRTSILSLLTIILEANYDTIIKPGYSNT